MIVADRDIKVAGPCVDVANSTVSESQSSCCKTVCDGRIS